VQKPIVVSLMCLCLGIFWWSGKVFIAKGDYRSVPVVSGALWIAALFFFLLPLVSVAREKETPSDWVGDLDQL